MTHSQSIGRMVLSLRDTPHGKNGEDQGRQGRILLTAPERRPKKRQDRKECQGVPSGHGGKKRAESEHANDCRQQNDGKRFGLIGPLSRLLHSIGP
jgi:hypothetical protein